MKNALLAIVMVAGVASVASGQTVSWVADGQGELDSSTFNFWLLKVDVPTDSDWLATALAVDLTEGSLGYEGGDVNPAASIFVGETPVFSYQVYADSTELKESATFAKKELSPTSLVLEWAGVPANGGSGEFTIGRFALSPDAVGNITRLETKFAADGPEPLTVSAGGDYTVSNGEIVPEPMTVSLLAFGGLALLRRKRK